MKLSVIIPVFNERNHILEVLAQVESVHLLENIEKEIILVDDFSTDGTREILSGIKKHKVVFHEKNKGKGAAIISGLHHATGEYTIIQDADLEYDPGDYNLLLAEVLNNGSTAVFGSRRLNRANKQYSGFTFYWGGFLITQVANWIYNLDLTDEPTCYKLVKTELLKKMNLESKRFEFCPEVVAKLARMGETIEEVPINYYPRGIHEGKKIRWHDGITAIQVLWKYRKWGKEKPHLNYLERFMRYLKVRRILKFLPRGGTLLDFGCGREGALLHYLNKNKIIPKAVGIDFHVTESSTHGVQLRRGGLERISSEEKFDAITLITALEKSEQPLQILFGLKKHLNPDGALVITTSGVWSKTILELLAKADFKVIAHKSFPFWMNHLVVAKAT